MGDKTPTGDSARPVQVPCARPHSRAFRCTDLVGPEAQSMCSYVQREKTPSPCHRLRSGHVQYAARSLYATKSHVEATGKQANTPA